MDWYCRRFPAGPKAFEGLQRLRSLRTIVVDENPEAEFYKVGLDPNTTEIVFIKPGNYKLAMSFTAEICLALEFGKGYATCLSMSFLDGCESGRSINIAGDGTAQP